MATWRKNQVIRSMYIGNYNTRFLGTGPYIPSEDGSSWRALTLHLIRVVLIFMCCHLNDVEQLIGHNVVLTRMGQMKNEHISSHSHTYMFIWKWAQHFLFQYFVHFFSFFSFHRSVCRSAKWRWNWIPWSFRFLCFLFIFTIIISSSSIKCIFVQTKVLIHLELVESEKGWKYGEISNCNLLLGHSGKFMATFIFIQLA